MPKVRRVVSVHEETVKNVGKGKAPVFKKGRRKSKKAPTVTVLTLDPLLVKWMKKHKVDYSTVEFISHREIYIRNRK